jgi:hypothetical protein
MGPFVQAGGMTEKSFEAVPLNVTLDTVRGMEPQFVMVTLCAVLVVPINWLEKLIDVPVLRHTRGDGVVAVPVMGMLRGLPVWLSVNTKFACSGPMSVIAGANATLTLQPKVGLRIVPWQPSEMIVKSAAFDPVIETPCTFTGTVVPLK